MIGNGVNRSMAESIHDRTNTTYASKKIRIRKYPKIILFGANKMQALIKTMFGLGLLIPKKSVFLN